MTEDKPASDRFRKTFLLVFTVGISLLFLAMIKSFLIALLMAAILSALTRPLYLWLARRFRGRKKTAALAAVLIVFLGILIPLFGFLGIVVAQALEVTSTVRPAIEQLVTQPNELDRWLQKLPFYERLEPYQDQIISKAGELAGRLGTFLVNSLAATTRGTAVFFFMLFIMLYSMFFFYLDGPAILDRLLYYLPLSPEDEARMTEKFVSVTRATVKGSMIIGVVQGGLAGLAFWVVGIEGSVFWGTVMVVLSIIPGVGATLVWLPAVIYLLAIGHYGAAIGLFLWCAALVSTVDNFLRPWLVGRDTKMSDLLILLSTLGGILLFGALGFIIGPIVAALFVTVWDIYGLAFKELLPPTKGLATATASAGGTSSSPASAPPEGARPVAKADDDKDNDHDKDKDRESSSS